MDLVRKSLRVTLCFVVGALVALWPFMVYAACGLLGMYDTCSDKGVEWFVECVQWVIELGEDVIFNGDL